jgi:ribosomal protein S18 acetylase RimI-like enzyme
MELTQLTPAHLPDAVDLVARRQADPGTHVAYLPMTAAAIEAELTGLEPDGLDGVLVALDAGDVVGLLGVEHDHDPPRAWWHGPYVAERADADEVVDELYRRARGALPDHVVQEELACDERSAFIAAFGGRHGFRPEESSAVLSRQLDGALPDGPAGPAVITDPTPTQRREAALLHDALFPGTHSPGGRALRAEPGRVTLVAVEGDGVIGYVAAEVQEDGSGYLDFLGVAPGARGTGTGRRLVAVACDILRAGHGCAQAHLTVRATNAAARRLYASLGFVEERMLQPWRKGFTPA